MRNQIAAANWKMNLRYQDAEKLLDEITAAPVNLAGHRKAIFAVPFPYLQLAAGKLAGKNNMFAAAQNCYSKPSGAYTGEVSVEMLASLNIGYVIIGHSERREYFAESNRFLAEKIDICLSSGITPIFCCGEPLNIRDSGTQNEYVGRQLQESLFHLSAAQLKQIVIAYEPIWAIGTGKTASSAQAQEMHAFIRQQLSGKYGKDTAEEISILYGGSVKGSNAAELFAQQDVDGGLVGGASLNAAEFITIINALP
ncbi:MAG TPA: triose-phosphate isomerase [Chitinophagaceae bacterium]